MGVNANAILKIPIERFEATFNPIEKVVSKGTEAENVNVKTFVGHNGQPLSVMPLKGGVVVINLERFAAEPPELAAKLWDILGVLAEEHDDEKGFFVYPHIATAQKDSYKGFIEEIGEAGYWVWLKQPPSEVGADNSEIPEGFESHVQQVMSMIGTDTMANLASAFATGDKEVLNRVGKEVEKLISNNDMNNPNRELFIAAQQAMGEIFSSDQDGSELIRQAQEQLERVREGNPELLDEIGKQFGFSDLSQLVGQNVPEKPEGGSKK